jgi:dihydrofolate synthase/folylpolyglutamate synthase
LYPIPGTGSSYDRNKPAGSLHIDGAAGTIAPFDSAGVMTNQPIDHAYQAALDYLYSFVDYSMTRALRYSPEKFDLGRMATFMDLLGNPQQDYPVLHIAGTKGKGSTAALCASALKAAGYRVGLYTSPHLEEYTERIQLNGKSISKIELVNLVDEIKPYVTRIQALTTFEITTALGFLYFSKQQVDVMVAEVGLGGRLDATNIITPVVSVITALSLDHMNVLGGTLAAIAAEKCGIIKQGVPAVSSPQPEEAMRVIQERAAESNSALTIVGRDILVEPAGHNLEGQSFYLTKLTREDGQRMPGGKREAFHIPLLGAHQIDNAAVAFAALDICNRRGLVVSLSAIKKGFRNVIWPGRFEILDREPFLVVDSAHNLDSARRLRQTLDDYLPGKEVILIFGASEDKDVSGILQELAPRVKRVLATKSEHPRALDPQDIARHCLRLQIPVSVIDTVEESLARACQETDDRQAIVATGSIFIAAAVKMIYRKRRKTPHEK